MSKYQSSLEKMYNIRIFQYLKKEVKKWWQLQTFQYIFLTWLEIQKHLLPISNTDVRVLSFHICT